MIIINKNKENKLEYYLENLVKLESNQSRSFAFFSYSSYLFYASSSLPISYS